MKQDTRSMTQDARLKLQETSESLAFIRAFIAETQSLDHDDAADEAQVVQMVERAAEPQATLSADVIRRLIARVECIA